jgi:hypothetical protein
MVLVAPVVVPAVAIDVLLLLQVPPAVVLLNDVVSPLHITLVPVSVFGFGFTVTTLVVKHPSPNV